MLTIMLVKLMRLMVIAVMSMVIIHYSDETYRKVGYNHSSLDFDFLCNHVSITIFSIYNANHTACNMLVL